MLDLTLTGQIDKELLSLEKYIATFGMNQKDLLNESSGLAVVPLGLEVADPISSCSGELSEYITRIHNRRADKSAGDDMHDDNEINSAVSRQNWGIDNEYSFGDRRESGIRQQQQGRQQQDYQYMPRILSGFPQDSSQNEYGYASNQRNIQQGYRQGNGRTPLTNQDKDNQSRSFSSQSSRKRRDASGSDVSYTRSAATLGDVEDGEESIECVEKSGEEIESRITTEFVGPHRENNIVGEEEYNPEEVADNEGRFKMEEDEAELLLAALGGRKH